MEEAKQLHHWDVLAICCIDGRFIKRTVDWVAEKTNGIFDFRTEVGCSKAICESIEDQERCCNLISTSKRLHDIKDVWLIDHIDCGAYGGSKEFENTEKEKDFHTEKLEEAAKILKVKFPELEIKKVFVDWKGVIEL